MQILRVQEYWNASLKKMFGARKIRKSMQKTTVQKSQWVGNSEGANVQRPFDNILRATSPGIGIYCEEKRRPQRPPSATNR
jgi:hypothetical protein